MRVVWCWCLLLFVDLFLGIVGWLGMFGVCCSGGLRLLWVAFGGCGSLIVCFAGSCGLLIVCFVAGFV